MINNQFNNIKNSLKRIKVLKYLDYIGHNKFETNLSTSIKQVFNNLKSRHMIGDHLLIYPHKVLNMLKMLGIIDYLLQGNGLRCYLTPFGNLCINKINAHDSSRVIMSKLFILLIKSKEYQDWHGDHFDYIKRVLDSLFTTTKQKVAYSDSDIRETQDPRANWIGTDSERLRRQMLAMQNSLEDAFQMGSESMEATQVSINSRLGQRAREHLASARSAMLYRNRMRMASAKSLMMRQAVRSLEASRRNLEASKPTNSDDDDY